MSLCRHHQGSSWHSNPKVDLLCRAIAEFDANLKVWPTIKTVNELIIAQQKRDAINHQLGEDYKRLLEIVGTGEGFSDSLSMKLVAYKLLRRQILASHTDVILSDILKEDSTYLTEKVYKENENKKSTKAITIQDALYYKRGTLSKLGLGATKAISKTQLDELRDELVTLDPRTILNFGQDDSLDLHLKQEHKIAALLDVDQTLINDKNGSLNESLINALLAARITDIYITTDMTARSLDNEATSDFINRMGLKRKLEGLGFNVTIVATGDAGYGSGLGKLFTDFFESYYGKSGDDLKNNMQKYADLTRQYNLKDYLNPDSSINIDRPIEKDLPLIEQLKEMVKQIKECLQKKVSPLSNENIKTYGNIIDLSKTEKFSNQDWQDFADSLMHKLLCMETDIYKLQAGELAKSHGYKDDKGALYEYVLSNLPSDISSVVAVDDKRSCLMSANQAKEFTKSPISLSTIQVMVGSFIQIHGKKSPIPELEQCDIQNEEIKIYYQPRINGNPDQIVAFWCDDGEIKTQTVNADILDEHPEIQALFGRLTTTTPRVIRANDKNVEFKTFFANIPAIFDQFPKQKNDFDPKEKQAVKEKYLLQLSKSIDNSPENSSSSSYYKNNLIYAALINMQEDYARHRKTHREDINHLIRDVKFILQQSEDQEKNTQLIVNKITEAFAKEERHFRKPSIGLFGHEKSHDDFITRLNQPSDNYAYPRMLLSIIDNYCNIDILSVPNWQFKLL